MKAVSLLLLVACLSFESPATEWIFLGPDSLAWRSIAQMDVSFRPGRPPYVGVGTSSGICWDSGLTWRYVCRDYYDAPFPILPEAVMYRAVFFSPWDDSTAFIGFNIHYMMEPGSQGGRVPDIFRRDWGVPADIGGGFVGYSPSLSFEFSPHRRDRVYSWMIHFFTSDDGGLSWDVQTSEASYGVAFLSVDLLQDSVLYVGRRISGETTHGIFRSGDDGATWSYVRPLGITAPYPSQRTAEMTANGDTLLLVVNRFPDIADTSCGISVSIDRGATWVESLPGMNVQKITRDEGSPNNWYAAAEGGIYRSENGGVTWHLYTDSLPSPKLVDIRKDPYSDTLYVATGDVGVYKIFDVTVGVGDARRVPDVSQLQQNYPNPFNPSTIIRYGLPSRSHVTLTVFNTLGQQVAILVQGEQEAGFHEAVFDASVLASGVYVYRLQSGETILSRKMVLVH